VREALSAIGISGEEIQQVSDPVFGKNVFQIQTRELGPSTVHKAQSTLESKFGIAENGFDSTSVGPTFGTQVANTALKALIFSLLIICAYVAFRFDPKFAVPVLIALFHDILITGGIYSLTGREVTSGTVAAFLTILGYSLYDTIIVFDRIRENMPRMPRAAFSQIVNRSMSEVLTRSLATSFTTLLAVVSLLIFGGATLQDFAFAMLVGIASGTYSSIFIASPVLTAWKEREPGFLRRRERIAAVEGSVPAFADDIELAQLGNGDESDAELEEEITTRREQQPKAGAVAIAEPPAEGDGGGPSSNGEAAADPASAAKRERDERRRARRQQRRKHGRKR
jgi:SecD/SecF fusion protein